MKKLFLLSALLLTFSLGFVAFAQFRADAGPLAAGDVPTASTAAPVVKAVTTAPAPSLTTVEFSEETHNFGELALGDTARHKFYILNTGIEDLAFTKTPKPSCGCTLTDYSKDPVAPGQRAFVEVIFPAKKAGVFRKTVTVTTNTEPAVKVIRFQGEVVAP